MKIYGQMSPENGVFPLLYASMRHLFFVGLEKIFPGFVFMGIC